MPTSPFAFLRKSLSNYFGEMGSQFSMRGCSGGGQTSLLRAWIFYEISQHLYRKVKRWTDTWKDSPCVSRIPLVQGNKKAYLKLSSFNHDNLRETTKMFKYHWYVAVFGCLFSGGKSAIMTALVVGLGGKAATTNRGNSLKGFIKDKCG